MRTDGDATATAGVFPYGPMHRTLREFSTRREDAPMSHSTPIPDLVPVLSRGKHRNPRRGACFMELASFLAGERWTDRPSCTHPLLAEVARNVNDRTSDAERFKLAPLIPSVIGLTTDDPRADARIALSCALMALPVVSAERQRALAVAVHACAGRLDALRDTGATELRTRARRTLADVPDADRWAASFATRTGVDRQDSSPRRFQRHAAPGIVTLAARGIAEAAVASPDALLRAMLEVAIEQCRALRSAPLPTPVDAERWRAAHALTR